VERVLKLRKVPINVRVNLPTSPETSCDFTSRVTTLLIFIGYSRSGHTLVASLLDAHPRVAVANEYDLVRQWTNFSSKQKTRRYVFDELFKNSVEQSKIGFRAPTLRRTFNFRVPHQWNGRCDKYLKVIGDKHGPAATKGLSTSHGLAYLDAMERHLHVRVRILHVIRHPLDNIATITVRQSHKRTFIEEVSRVHSWL
jgi:hypothetical protein